MNYSGSVELNALEVVDKLVEHLELAHEAYELLELLKLHGGLKELEDQLIEDKKAMLKNKKLRLTDEVRAKLEMQVKHAQDDLRESTINDWGGLTANWRAFEDKQVRYTTIRPDSLLEELRDTKEVVSLLKSAFDSLSYDSRNFMDKLRDNNETVELWMQLCNWRGRV